MPKKLGKIKYIEGIGRRKESTARVRVYPTRKTGEFIVNQKNYQDYFPLEKYQQIVTAPLKLINRKINVSVKVKGGGITGQAEAIRLGLARALVKLNEAWRPEFRKLGLLTRDPRMVERKKYGLRKARRARQWRKR